MRIKVEVTEEDVKQGRPDCFTCPIAIEINRHLKDGFYAAVYPTALEIYQSKRPLKSYDEYRLASKAKRVFQTNLPQPAIRFIRAFDGCVQFEDRRRTKPPTKFSVVIPSRFATKKKTTKTKKKKPWFED